MLKMFIVKHITTKPTEFGTIPPRGSDSEHGAPSIDLLSVVALSRGTKKKKVDNETISPFPALCV
jgi:hypothetical protein